VAFWCYILRCADGNYYTGHTDDLERRMAEHLHGGFCEFTSRRLPAELIWSADFPTRHEALEAELRVKKWSRAKKEALATSDWDRLKFYSRPPRERVSTSLDTNGNGEADIHLRPPRERVSTSLDTNGIGGVDIRPSVRIERSRDARGRGRP